MLRARLLSGHCSAKLLARPSRNGSIDHFEGICASYRKGQTRSRMAHKASSQLPTLVPCRNCTSGHIHPNVRCAVRGSRRWEIGRGLAPLLPGVNLVAKWFATLVVSPLKRVVQISVQRKCWGSSIAEVISSSIVHCGIVASWSSCLPRGHGYTCAPIRTTDKHGHLIRFAVPQTMAGCECC